MDSTVPVKPEPEITNNRTVQENSSPPSIENNEIKFSKPFWKNPLAFAFIFVFIIIGSFFLFKSFAASLKWKLSSSTTVSSAASSRATSIYVSPGEVVSFYHNIKNHGPNTATYNEHVNSYHYSSSGKKLSSSTLNVGNRKTAAKAVYLWPDNVTIPSSAQPGDRYCRIIIYSNATGPGSGGSKSNQACAIVALFHDEFSGGKNAAPSAKKWLNNFINCNQFGSNYSCMKNENAFMDGVGNLHLRIKRDGSTTTGFSGAIIGTLNWSNSWPPNNVKADFPVPFHIEMRAKMPDTNGAWPALWTVSSRVPSSGNLYELDVAEEAMTYPTSGGCHQHTWQNGGEPDIGKWDGVGAYVSSMGKNWHVYSANVKTNSVDYFVDGAWCGTAYGVSGYHGIILDNLLNCPVKGAQVNGSTCDNWASGGKEPTGSGPWDMIVDYVRVTHL